MAEYIERDKAKELICNYGKGAISDGMKTLDPVDDIVCLCKSVDLIPSADVAPVVRCRECKYWKAYDRIIEIGICKKTRGEYGENDFCSYGERKGQGES